MAIELALQYKNGIFYPHSPEDAEKAREYKNNQVVRSKITGIKKRRSYEQLKLFFACAKLVAENTEDPNWNTKDKVCEQVKISARYIDYWIQTEGS